MIHAYLPTEHALQVFADLQRNFDSGYVETQSEFLWRLGKNYPSAFGPERTGQLMPLHAYLQRNIVWAGGSDSPVAPIPARHGLAAVARHDLRAHGVPRRRGLPAPPLRRRLCRRACLWTVGEGCCH